MNASSMIPQQISLSTVHTNLYKRMIGNKKRDEKYYISKMTIMAFLHLCTGKHKKVNRFTIQYLDYTIVNVPLIQ